MTTNLCQEHNFLKLPNPIQDLLGGASMVANSECVCVRERERKREGGGGSDGIENISIFDVDTCM